MNSLMIKKGAVQKHMIYATFTRGDVLVLFVIVFPYLVVVNYLMMGKPYFSLPLFLPATLVSVCIGIASWATHIIAANVIRWRISGYSNAIRRVCIQFPVYIMLSLLLGISLFGAANVFGFTDRALTWSNFQPLFIAGILLNVAATSFHEGLYAFDKWKSAMLEAERLKKNYLQSQLEGLKSQVNPHFLFNSLNSLSALIYINPDKASDFVDEMSKVYRYLLRANDRWLITLENELGFTYSFFHLLKTRYEEGIELTINVEPGYLSYLLPPLTLQMLIENAVKHNAVSRHRPLKIDLFTDDKSRLIVRNTLQKKKTPVLSNGIGLQNIIDKYQLLNESRVDITDDGQHFTVTLPLIEDKKHADFDH